MLVLGPATLRGFQKVSKCPDMDFGVWWLAEMTDL